MFEPKVPAIGAAIGFVLSLLVGFFAGASFIVVLLRALIMGLLFGGLAFIGKFLVMKYLPELASQSEGIPPETADQGSIVDITLGGQDKEENPFSTLRAQPQDDMVPDFLKNSEKTDLEPRSEQEIQAETNQDSFRPTPFLGASNETNDSRDTPERAKKGPSGGLDVLPDLDDFVPHAIDGGESNKDEEEASQGLGESSRDLSFGGGDSKASAVESETMVKAIRTILTRDT
jgi:hypothetical protein